MLFSLKMAWSYFRKIWSRGILGVMVLISVMGITLGVASLVVTLSVMNGFHTEITQRLLALNPHIVVMNPLSSVDTEKAVAEILDGESTVESISGFIYSKGLLYKNNESHGAVIKGVAPGSMSQKLTSGSWDDLAGRGMVLGAELAYTLGLSVDDEIFLVMPTAESIGTPMIPRIEQFTVAGVFSSGMHEYDSGLAYIDIEAAAGFGDKTVSSGAEIYISDPFRTAHIAGMLENNLRGPYSVQTWQERNYNLFAALKLEKTMMFIVLVMIIIVATFNVAGSLIMVSVTRSRDCGIMRAVGATRRQIRMLFNFKGLFIGFFGAVSGTVLGIAASMLISKYQFIELPPQVYLISTLPVRISAADISVVIITSLIISFIATIYPARRAGRMEVAGELRYE